MDNKEKNNIIPVLLSGGSGTRLWPMSRTSYPKQFLNFNPNNKFSFLQETQNRLITFEGISDPIIICNSDHRFIVAEQMREINVCPKSIILEPLARNTAPAITIAALKAIEDGSDPCLLILPADHFINDVEKFISTINEGIKFAEEGSIVTFGIPPNSPETGYGYIKVEKSINFDENKAFKIESFLEKPLADVAKKLILDKSYFWNSGIFLCKASTIIHEIRKYSSDILSYCKKSLEDGFYDLDFQRLSQVWFEKCDDISFDIAVMQKTFLGVVLVLDVGWSDAGSWDSMWEISKKDNNGNVFLGKVFSDNVRDCYLKSDERLIVGSNIENLIIVETNDVILVTQKGYSQKLKEIVSKLRKSKFDEALNHKKVFRPWGNYFLIAKGPNWQVKTIFVNPGASLSLQKHNHRTEHWIVVEGSALVEINEDKTLLNANESTFIPLGSKHRLSNPGQEPLQIIEVQNGSYLGEDDIIRYEDSYGRT